MRCGAGERQDETWKNWLVFSYLPEPLAWACWEQRDWCVKSTTHSLQAFAAGGMSHHSFRICLVGGSKASRRIQRSE